MKENYVKAFLKKFWWVPLSLTLLLLISLGIYLYVFQTKLFDASAWASLVSGIFTYIGSSFLGVVVFYHSWLQTQITNKLEEVDLIIQSGLLQIDGQWCPFSEKDLQSVVGDYYSHRYGSGYSGAYSYLKFEIINNNIYAPINVQFVEVFFLNEKGNIEQCHNLVCLCDTINSLYLSKDSKSTS